MIPASAARQSRHTSAAVIRTPDQRLRVFVSSTLKELAAEREAARQAIDSMRLIPVMFETGARPHPPRNLYRAYLEQSHVFIGIYWQQYGWVAPGMNISGLEDEFQLARDLPRLLYFKKPAPDREKGLTALLRQIQDEADVSYKYFSSPAELAELISNDLAVLLTERFEQARLTPAVPEMPVDNPPGGRFNLPRPVTSLIGRETDAAAVSELLSRPQVRLVTLIGPGGVGKTRLALEAAAGLQDKFEGGIYWVNLAPIREPDLIITTVAQALSVGEREGQPLLESLQEYLREKRLLLLLDNLEQVIAGAPLLAELLAAAPDLKILATSRVALRLQAEHEYPVQPLQLPESLPSASKPLPDAAAVHLFVERAQAARPDFSLTPENGRDVVEIVRRLDGLPLAIELAAARVKLLPTHLILARLDDQLKLLTGGPQDLPPRQQTMRNVIHWSYELLSPQDQTLFARLGVFVDGFTLDAAEVVCNLNNDLDIFEGAAALLDNSLLQPAAVVDDQPRFTMLETVREYAYEQLQECTESQLVHQQHADFFVEYALLAREKLFSGDGERWLERLSADIGNFRAVLEWSQTSPQFWPASWPLIPGLVWFTYRSEYLQEARLWCERVIAQTANLGDDPLRASIMVHAGLVAMWQSDLATAARLMDEGVAMMRQVGDTDGLLDVLFPRGVLAVNQSDGERAQQLFDEALPLFEAAGQSWFQAMIHLHLGNVAFSRGGLDEAKRRTETAHNLGRQLSDPWIVASAVNNFGELARYQGNHDAAQQFYLESRELFGRINSSPDIARANHSLAWVMLACGDAQKARTLFVQAQALHEQLGIKRGVAECLAGLAAVLAAEGKAEAAATLFAAVQARFHDLGTKLWPADEHDLERYLALARGRLDEATFSAAWERGQSLPFAQALAYAASL